MKKLMVLFICFFTLSAEAQYVGRINEVTTLPTNPIPLNKYLYQGNVCMFVDGAWRTMDDQTNGTYAVSSFGGGTTDSTIWAKAWKLGLYQPIGTYTVPSDTTLIHNQIFGLRGVDSTRAIAREGLKQNAGTYLVPSDSTSNRTFSDLKYLKNADSTSNRTFSDLKYLKNADSTSNRTFSDLKYAPKISPVLVTPNLGTPTAGVLTSCTGTAAGLTSGTVTTNANLAGDVTSVGNTTTIKTSVTLTTPIIGVATGTSLAVTSAITSSGAGIGYVTGAGGVVTQGSSRTTTVVLSKLSGTITMFSAAVAAAASSTFTWTNTFIAATDIVIMDHNSITNPTCWKCEVICAAGSATVVVKNISAASITEATPLKFIVLKSSGN